MERDVRNTGPIFVHDKVYVITYIRDGEVYLHVGDEDLVLALYDESGREDGKPTVRKIDPATGAFKRVRTITKIEFEEE